MSMKPVIRSFGVFPCVRLFVEDGQPVINGFLTCTICREKGTPNIPLNVVYLPYFYKCLGEVRVSRLICSLCFWREYLPDPIATRRNFTGLIPEEPFAQIMFEIAFAKEIAPMQAPPKISVRSHRFEFAGQSCAISTCGRVKPEVWKAFIESGLPYVKAFDTLMLYGVKTLDLEVFPSICVEYDNVKEFYCTECFMDLIAMRTGRCSHD